eukprot:INCI4998.9.p1 GENE.INCI4998.9~~INCI4998.9.p1  ORF type:complete len:1527 (+),score=269.06 INCI4998.9:207-4583(+)
MGKGGGGRKKKGPKFLPDGTPLTNKAKKQVSREERAAQRAKEAKKLMEEASKKAKAEADRTKNKKKKAGGGSKKGSKKAAAEEPPVLVGGPRKQGRGHRQKGGGTVQKSKGDVYIHSVGLWRHEAERFPSEILQQYCQKNKLPKAHIMARAQSKQHGGGGGGGHEDTDAGNWQGCVKMPDPKGKKEKDRYFRTVETFATKELAKQGASLLALFEYDGQRPFNRQFPDPFGATWKSLQAQASGAAPAKPKAVPKVPPTVPISKTSESTDSPGASDSTDKNVTSKAAEAKRKASHLGAVPTLTLTTGNSVHEQRLKTESRRVKQKAYEDKAASRARRERARHLNIMLSQKRRRTIRHIIQSFHEDWERSLMRSKLHSASLQSSNPIADAVSSEVTIDETDVAHIEHLGFTEVQAREALGCLRVAKFARNQQRRIQCAVDWLLIKLNEEDLPPAFDPRGFNLEVHHGSKSAKSTSKPNGAVSTPGDAGARIPDQLRCLSATNLDDIVFTYAQHSDAPLALFGAPSRSKTIVAKLVQGSRDEGLAQNFCRALAFFRQHFAATRGGFAASVDEELREILTGLEPELLDQFRDQVVDELVACKSIYADDFTCFPAFAIGTSLAAVGDGVDELESAIDEHRGDAFLAVLKLRAEESVVPGQGFLQVLIDKQRHSSARASDGSNYSVAFLYSNSSLSAAQLFYINLQLAQHCLKSIPDTGIAAIQYWLSEFFVDVSLDPIVVDEVFVAAVQQATAGKSRGTTKASLGANTAGSSSSIGRTRVNVFATTRRNESTSRGRSRPRRRNMPHLSDELQAEAKAKTQGASADFKKMTEIRQQLPVFKFRERILQALDNDSQVLLVQGETGCGKSTQVPQFILEHCIAKGEAADCSIVCTQPRRIAATGIASRVADERCEKCGDVVGYAVRGDSSTSDRTRLLFCTTGVVLRRLQDLATSSTTDITHLLIDEVHERDINTDFLLCLIRRILVKNRKLKVVLMSATLDAEKFVAYFGGPKACPSVKVPGRTFPVSAYYLDDMLASIPNFPVPDMEHRAKQAAKGSMLLAAGGLDRARQLLPYWNHNDGIPYDQIAALVRALATGEHNLPSEPLFAARDVKQDHEVAQLKHRFKHAQPVPTASAGSILIFLPGKWEISRCQRALENLNLTGNCALWILQLHGSLPGNEQRQVFQRPPAGKRKVVLATNIAETSITINDCVFVIDTLKLKEMRFNPRSQMSELLECWTSQASANQRKGRAGRVRRGFCFRLIPGNCFMHENDALKQGRSAAPRVHEFADGADNGTPGEHSLRSWRLARYQEPEIRRASLEQLCLQILKLDFGDPVDFLANALDPPDDKNVKAAMDLLREVKAVKYRRFAASSSARLPPRLTPLGQHLGNMPLDVRYAKCLVYGSLLCCIEPVITVIACMSVRGVFHDDRSQPKEAIQAARKEAGCHFKQSDHLSFLKVRDILESS